MHTPAPAEGRTGQEDLGHLLDRAPCGFVAFRDDSTVIAVNTTLCEMLGVSRDDLLGASLDRIMTVPARIFYQTHFFPLLTLHGAAEEIYFTLRHRDGHAVHVLANATRRTAADGARTDCVFMRIHERQKYERELLLAKKAAEEADQARIRFLSMMSHDLRTPINAVSGYADLLLMGVRGEITPEQAHDLQRIKGASAFLLRLLDDILSYARIELGEVSVKLESIDVSTALRRAEALMMPRFAEARLRYERGPCQEALRVHADAHRLQQVLLNLLSNAAKFTAAGGSVNISCARVGDTVEIRVADTGRGIPQDKLEVIFEPFQQAEAGDAGNQGGVGLGLAISRDLARAMGGDLDVTSTVGQGSTFRLRLPASVADAAEAPAAVLT